LAAQPQLRRHGGLVVNFRDLAISLFRKTPPPSARVSHLIKVNQRQVQYWLSGRSPVPLSMFEILFEQLRVVKNFGLQQKIDHLVSEAEDAGVDIQIIVHYLDQTVDRLKERADNS
jgi:hypothetical protein